MGIRRYVLVFMLTMALSCREKEADYIWKPMTVTATAYNSLPSQTSKIHPGITAWGDSIKPGMKYIAVSRDLLQKGLKYNTKVKIKGMEGVYTVKDKMHHRWRNRIDIYMGVDKKMAKEWGRRKVEILFAVLKDSASLINTIEMKNGN